MKAAFIMKALLAEEFESLFEANDEELARRNATWLNVDSNPGYPCRVTLSDAEVGERVLAIAFDHHDVASPYKSAGPILIRDNAVTRKLDVNEVPEMFHHRLLSIRGYDFDHMMTEAKLQKE